MPLSILYNKVPELLEALIMMMPLSPPQEVIAVLLTLLMVKSQAGAPIQLALPG